MPGMIKKPIHHPFRGNRHPFHRQSGIFRGIVALPHNTARHDAQQNPRVGSLPRLPEHLIPRENLSHRVRRLATNLQIDHILQFRRFNRR